MNRISFDNKLKTLNINGKYIISSENINEIKDVVNSLFSILDDEDFNCNSIFKYLMISLPDELENFNYELKVFFNDIEYSTIENPEKFFIFENGQFVKIYKRYLTKNDSSKIILVITPENISFDNLKVKYYIKNIVNNKIYYNPSDYSSFGRSYTSKSDIQYFLIKNENDLISFNFAVSNNCFDKVVNRLNYYYLEKEQNLYNLSGKFFDGEFLIDAPTKQINLTNNFSTGNEVRYEFNDTYKNVEYSKSINFITFPSKIYQELMILSGSPYLKLNDESYINPSSVQKFDMTFVDRKDKKINSALYEKDYIQTEIFEKESKVYPIGLNINFNRNSMDAFNTNILFSGSILYNNGSERTIDFLNDEIFTHILNNNDKLSINFNKLLISLNSEIIFNEIKNIIFNYDDLFLIKEINLIDIIPPDAPIVSADIVKPTQKNVTLSATYSFDSAFKEYSFDNENWLNYSENTGVIVTENKLVYFRAIDEAKNISDVTEYDVTNIDRIPPDAPIVIPDIVKPTQKNVTLSSIYSEDSYQKQYSFNNENWNEYGAPVVVTENRPVYFRGIDEAENISDVTEYDVTNIDRIPPDAPIVIPDIIEETSGNVTLSAIYSEDSYQKQYSFDNENWNEYSAPIVVTENMNLYFRGIDEAENISDVTEYDVTNIVPPLIFITGEFISATHEKSPILTKFKSDNRNFHEINISKNCIQINDSLKEFLKNSYLISDYEISKLNNGKYVNGVTFKIDKLFDHSFPIAFRNLNSGTLSKAVKKFNIVILSIGGSFIDNLNNVYTLSFIHEKENDIWIIKDLPIKLKKLENIYISLAFNKKEN